MPASAPALKTAIYDKKAKGKGHTESLFLKPLSEHVHLQSGTG